jgi:hypothetical protein
MSLRGRVASCDIKQLTELYGSGTVGLTRESL